MCVILHRLQGNPVDREDLAAAHKYNNDGCGILYVRGSHIISRKGLWTIDELLKQIEEAGDDEYLLHLRIKTHGKVNEKNCHPFYIGGGNWMMHNGILSDVQIKDADRSDTFHFSRMLHDSGYGPVVHTKGVLDLVESIHGFGNRMAFATTSGFYRTGSWDTHEDNYWSNTHWQTRVACNYSKFQNWREDDYSYGNYSSSGWVRTNRGYVRTNDESKATTKNPHSETEADLTDEEMRYIAWWEARDDGSLGIDNTTGKVVGLNTEEAKADEQYQLAFDTDAMDAIQEQIVG